MEFTNMTLDCYGTTPTSDTEAFRIEATVTAAGELPTTALFVFSMDDADRPDADNFARIANPQDLQTLGIDRAAAVSAGTDEYLAPYASFQYADLDQAVSAKSTLKGRVNELVNRWISYQTDFTFDTGASTSFPSSDPTQEAALTTVYTDAKAARLAAESTYTIADTAVTTATTTVDQSKAFLPTVQRATDSLTRIKNEYGAYVLEVITESSTGTTLKDALTTFITTESANFAGALQTQVNTIAGQEAALATAKGEKIEAASILTAAQAAEDAALAALLAVVPDFDPATV